MNNRINTIIAALISETERQPVTTYSSTVLAGLQELRTELAGASAVRDLAAATPCSGEAERLLRDSRVHIARVATIGAQRLAGEIHQFLCAQGVQHG